MIQPNRNPEPEPALPYLPNTGDDRRAMLRRIGVENFEEFLESIPDDLRLKRPLDIPELSEMELLREIEQLAHASREGLGCFA